MNRWYRAYEGTVSDPKIGEVAILAESSRSVAVATWHSILESCASTNAGGRFETNARRVASVLGEPVDLIERVFAGLKKVGMTDGRSNVLSWARRQFESDSSTERSRKSRERKRTAPATPPSVAATLQQRDATAPKTEAETNTEVKKIDGGVVTRARPTPDQAERVVLAGPLFKQFKDAYRGPCGREAERKFKALFIGGENPDPIIAAAHRAGPDVAAEQWLDERAWAQLSLLPEEPKVTISPAALELGNEIAKIAGQDLQFLEPGWCGAAWRCQQWINNGWPQELIVAGVTAMVKRKHPEKISGHAYFEQGLARFIAQQQRPVPKVVEHQQQTVEVTRGSSTASHDSRSGIVAIADVYSEIRAKTEGQHRRGGDVPEQAVQRLPS